MYLLVGIPIRSAIGTQSLHSFGCHTLLKNLSGN